MQLSCIKEQVFRVLHTIRKSFSNFESIGIIGMFLSIACAIHCMAFPLLILLAPIAGFAFFENELLEHLSLAVSIFISAISLYAGFQNHKKIQLIALFVFSILILIMSNWFVPIIVKPWTDALGAFSIAATLFLNLRLTHKHGSSCKN